MNRYLAFSLAVSMTLGTLAIPLRAANKPRAGTDLQGKVVWTNDDLDKLHDRGLISIVGQVEEETSIPGSEPKDYDVTQDPKWYAQQAARLRDELDWRQARLREYRHALDDARSLRESTGGIDLVGEDFAMTPEEGIEILQQRVEETQTDLTALEDLARRNDIEPGTLRGQ
jgi:hypothetical protein